MTQNEKTPTPWTTLDHCPDFERFTLVDDRNRSLSNSILQVRKAITRKAFSNLNNQKLRLFVKKMIEQVAKCFC